MRCRWPGRNCTRSAKLCDAAGLKNKSRKLPEPAPKRNAKSKRQSARLGKRWRKLERSSTPAWKPSATKSLARYCDGELRSGSSPNIDIQFLAAMRVCDLPAPYWRGSRVSARITSAGNCRLGRGDEMEDHQYRDLRLRSRLVPLEIRAGLLQCAFCRHPKGY